MCFDPRPRGGATRDQSFECQGCDVSIHAPVGGRRYVKEWTPALPVFRSTPPWGGDEQAGWTSDGTEMFRSTPPWGGDLKADFYGWLDKVSIHAPVGGRRPAFRKRR